MTEENPVYINIYSSPLGKMILSSDGKYLTGLRFEGKKFFEQEVRQQQEIEKALPVFDEAFSWLNIYFSGKAPDFTPPLLFDKSSSTEFRKDVWEILLTIPFGKTMSYGQIAQRLTEEYKSNPARKSIKTMSAQAVGQAARHNPILLIVPCHRVVGADGSVTGYAGEVERKIWLLNHEEK